MVLVSLRGDDKPQEARKAARSARFGEEAPNYDPSNDAVLQSADGDAVVVDYVRSDQGDASSDEGRQARARRRPPPVQCRRMPASESGALAAAVATGGAVPAAPRKLRTDAAAEKKGACRTDKAAGAAGKAEKKPAETDVFVGYGYGGQPFRFSKGLKPGQSVQEPSQEPECVVVSSEQPPPPARRLVLRSRTRSPQRSRSRSHQQSRSRSLQRLSQQQTQQPKSIDRHEHLQRKLARLRQEAMRQLEVRRTESEVVDLAGGDARAANSTGEAAQRHNGEETQRRSAGDAASTAAVISAPPGNFNTGGCSRPPHESSSSSSRPPSNGEAVHFHKSASRARSGPGEGPPMAISTSAGPPGTMYIPAARPPVPQAVDPCSARAPLQQGGWPATYPPHGIPPHYPPGRGPPALAMAAPPHHYVHPMGYGYLPPHVPHGYMLVHPGFTAAGSATSSGSDSSCSRSRSRNPRRKGNSPSGQDRAGKGKKKRKRVKPRMRLLKKAPTPDQEPTLEEQGLWGGGVPGPLGISQEKSGWKVVLHDEFRRTFVSLRKEAFSENALRHWWKVLSEQIPWGRPTALNKKAAADDDQEEEKSVRTFPRSACWLTTGGCTCSYEYSGTKWDPIQMPTWFDEITDYVCRTCNLTDRPNCCNANYYEHGREAVGWHADDEPLFASTERDVLIVSLSLGETRTFELHPKDAPEKVSKLTLDSGDLCTMEGLCQKHYRHRVPPDFGNCGPRINLTWRWILNHQPGCPVA